MRVVATALMRAAPALITSEQEVVLVRHRPRDGSNRKFERTTPMHVTSRKLLFLVTALVEAATGLCLLVVPAVPLAVLLGFQAEAVETSLVGRIAGAALVAIAIASWEAGSHPFEHSPRGLVTGILLYNAAVSTLLAYAGAVLNMTGILLWPAVALHSLLAIWCLRCLLRNGRLYRAAAPHALPVPHP